jgi:hypothetical protein
LNQPKPQRIFDKTRILKQIRFETEELPLHLSEISQYFDAGFHGGLNEPFAFLHNH